jgi:hypothetical protein
METIPAFEPPGRPGPSRKPGEDVEDVKEPPLPGTGGSKDNFPGKDDLIDPTEGGGRIKESAR